MRFLSNDLKTWANSPSLLSPINHVLSLKNTIFVTMQEQIIRESGR